MTTCACGARPLTMEETGKLEKFRDVLTAGCGQAGALIPLLQKAQTMFGYLPDQVLREISVRLGKPYSEVAGVVSFYAFFSTKPRGRHLVRVCLGTACYVRGAQKVLEAIKKYLGIEVGETTEDRVFTLETGSCFGTCGLAPAVMVDNDVHQRVQPDQVGQILDQYRMKASLPKGRGEI